MISLARRASAEAIGSAALAAIVIGSGVMAERLAGGNAAIALLANTVATATGLYALIVAFAPVSGAHFNPLVTLACALRRELQPRDAAVYVLVQTGGMLGAAVLVHAMFELPLWFPSTKPRAGAAQALSEAVATFMLMLAIHATRRRSIESAAGTIASTIAAGYWFTASTSFANPAITLARALSDTFAGIRMADVPLFWLGQIAGALLAGLCLPRLFADMREGAPQTRDISAGDSPRRPAGSPDAGST
jgi:glycerol uptake facilitator-like aquaporin